MNFGTNPQHDFPKMRGGGGKGRLELFRKFIRFGEGMLPLSISIFFKSVDISTIDISYRYIEQGYL